MDESSDIKLTNLGDELLENVEKTSIAVLNNISEVEAIGKGDLFACKYSGDAELECLKKELVDFDVKEPAGNLMIKPGSCEANSNQHLEVNDQIEDYEMASVDSEYSSGVGSNSDASNDFSNGSVHLITKNDEPIEEHVGDKLNDLNVANTGKVTFDETLELANLKAKDNDTISENMNSENNPQDLTETTGELNFKAILNQMEIKDEMKSVCIAGASKSVEPGPLPITKFRGKIKLRESNPQEFVVPFIGKKIDWGDPQPCPFNPEIADAINRQNFERNGRFIPKLSFQEYIKKRQSRTKEEIERDDQREQFIAFRVAAYALKNLSKILLQMQKDEPNEERIIEYFKRFLKVPVTPLAMIHIPQFVHTVMYIRGCPEFSLNVRQMADRCFDKIHVLFPIPDGYNFETVYTNEIQKCLPDEMDGMYDFLLEYDDFEWESEDEDSAFSDDADLDK